VTVVVAIPRPRSVRPAFEAVGLRWKCVPGAGKRTAAGGVVAVVDKVHIHAAIVIA
jgi:hypothetical protein